MMTEKPERRKNLNQEGGSHKKMLLIVFMISGLTAGCAGTGNYKEGKSGQGENIPLDAVEAGEMQ